jgi:hypothetical protein
MLRGVGAVVLGYIIMAVIVMIGSVALLASVVPGGMAALKTMRGNPDAMPKPTPRYFAMNLTLSAIAALVGGWVTKRVAGEPSHSYVLALASMTVLLGALTAFKGTGAERQPTWYKVVIPLIGAVGVLLGARLAGA